MPPSSGGRADAGEPEDRGRPALARLLRREGFLRPVDFLRRQGLLPRRRQVPRRLRLARRRALFRGPGRGLPGRLPRLPRPSSRARKIEAVLAVCGLLAGFGLTLAGLSALRAGRGHAETQPSSPPPEAVPAAAVSAAALDTEWARYADHSTCADWAGADGVSAVPIGGSQLAWFFSDTYLGPVAADTGFKTISGFIHNSVVVQTTQHGTTRFTTLTGGGACSAPGGSSQYATSVVSPPAIGGHAERYWNADGIVAGGDVLRFYNGFTRGQPPFVPVTTVIARFTMSGLRSASAADPAGGGVVHPALTTLPNYTPVAGGTPVAWGSALLRAGGTLYVYGWASPDHTEAVKQLYLARVRVSQLTDYAAWQYYAGAGQWSAAEDNAQPVQRSGADFNISTGFSVLRLGGKYWLIQQESTTGSPDIVAFPAPHPWGPFDPSGRILLYHAPDVGLNAAHDFRIMYEARAEPALSTRQNLMISYNVNSVGVTTGCQPLSAFTDTITRPRFISVPVAAFTGASGSPFTVQSGPSPYTDVTSKNPSQWFNSWAYPGGCPPVPGLSDVSAQAVGNGTVSLHWQDAGLGLAYRVYQRVAGGSGYRLVNTVSADGTQVRGLGRGVTYEFLVEPVNSKRKTGAGATATLTAS